MLINTIDDRLLLGFGFASIAFLRNPQAPCINKNRSPVFEFAEPLDPQGVASWKAPGNYSGSI